MYISSALIDFAIGLVNSVINLLDGQEKFWGNPNYRRISNHSLLLFIYLFVYLFVG